MNSCGQLNDQKRTKGFNDHLSNRTIGQMKQRKTFVCLSLCLLFGTDAFYSSTDKRLIYHYEENEEEEKKTFFKKIFLTA